MDLSEIFDGELGDVKGFTIIRTTGSFKIGGFTLDTPVEIKVPDGLVTMLNVKEINQVPEGDRVKGSAAFYVPVEIKVSRAQEGTEALQTESGEGVTVEGGEVVEIPIYDLGISDRIRWNGDTYKLFSVANYSAYGYWKGVGVREVGT
jgi:hypothetical protein